MSTHSMITEYFENLKANFSKVEINDRNMNIINFENGINLAAELLTDARERKKKIILIGNGANAGIINHIAADMTKVAKLQTISFNNPAALSAIANDIGANDIFALPMEIYAQPGDIVIALSSSGSSPNIIKAIDIAKSKDIDIITLSGFKSDNTLRSMGNYNFYVPWMGYDIVEIIHHSILHCLVSVCKTP